MERKIEFITTKETLYNEILYTVKIDGLFIHSKYYPLKESERYVNSIDIEDKKHIVLYGLGLGYHVLQIANTFSNIDLIEVYELTSDIYNYHNASFFKVINILKKHSKVKLHIKKEKDSFFNDFVKSLNDCDKFIVYNPCLKIISSEFVEFKESILEFQAQKKAESVYKNKLDLNRQKNKKLKASGLGDFFQKYNFKGKTVIVISAGPSLSSCFRKLKQLKNRDDIFMISVGTSIKVSISNGVVPDAFCILDCSDVIYDQVSGIEDKNIPMLFLDTSSSKASYNYKGPKYIYYNSNRASNVVVDCANSVATAAISIAILGKAKKIVLVGQDLAYVNNRVHVENTVYGENHVYVKRDGDTETLDVYGNRIYTNKFYLSIKRWIENTVKYNPNIEFINCSKGANIIGCTNLDIRNLEKYI